MSKRPTANSSTYKPRFTADFGQAEDRETARESFRRFYEQGSSAKKARKSKKKGASK